MIADKRFGNHFSLQIFGRPLVGESVHISYYYDVGRFKLLSLPSILEVLKSLRRKREAIKNQRPVEGLGALFS